LAQALLSRPQNHLQQDMPPKRRKNDCSYARFDAWARSEICTLRSEGYEREEIRQQVCKTDGKPGSLKAIDGVLEKKRKCPDWRGENSSAGGRPRELTTSEVKQLTDLVFEERAKAVVTVKYCRKRLLFLRRVSRKTVERALHQAGLAWLRRREKRAVPKEWREKRMGFAKWVLTLQKKMLKRWAYTDGTTFYLARGPAEHCDKQRACLGKFVWRMANGKDGLDDANIGGSMYAKSQGVPVKIWGFFAGGQLHYWVLPADEKKKTKHMNGERYSRLVRTKFATWRKKCFRGKDPVYLVQDHEKCLWQDRCLKAIRGAGLRLVTNFPKHSPDLNAIERWWARLRDRLDSQAPEAIEGRQEFIRRLRRTVSWMNQNIRKDALYLATNQKERVPGLALRKTCCSPHRLYLYALSLHRQRHRRST